MVVYFAVTAVLYALTGILYFAYLGGLSERVAVWARRTMVTAFAANTVEMAAHGFAGLHPVSSVREAIGFAAWLLVGVYLLAQLRRRLDAVGAFVAPVALVLDIAARLAPGADDGVVGLGVLGRVHIALASFGVSVFGLATAVAVLYLVEERQLKRRKFSSIVRKGPALETLDNLGHRCVQVGFPIFTVAMIAGAWWGTRLDAGLRPEYVIAGVAWVAFAALLIARVTAGWRGRRAALLTIVGFTASLVVLGVYLARSAGQS
jgi:ABC-type uncharacterized transport system permease subunit